MIVRMSKGTNINTAMAHLLSDPMIQFYRENGGEICLNSLPICPKCERVGLRDKGWSEKRIMTCPHCGYSGQATYQLSTYLKQGMYK